MSNKLIEAYSDIVLESDFYDKYYDEYTDEHDFTGAIVDSFLNGKTISQIAKYIGWTSEDDIQEIQDTIEEAMLGSDAQLKEYRDWVEQAKRRKVSQSDLSFLKKLLKLKEDSIKDEIEEIQNDIIDFKKHGTSLRHLRDFNLEFEKEYLEELQDELKTGLDTYHKE